MAATRGIAHWFLWSTFVTIAFAVVMVRRAGRRRRLRKRRRASR
jgi:hypothetical protein